MIDAIEHTAGPKPLQTLCVELLSEYLDELFEQAEEVIPELPPSVKATLIAVARRQGSLDDNRLEALADEEHSVMVLHACPKVTDNAARMLAERCHRLHTLDVSECDMLSASAICSIVKANPQLATLRCGGSKRSHKTMRIVVQEIFPRLKKLEEAPSVWEDWSEEEMLGGNTSLSCIIWPGIEPSIQQQLMAECPRVRVETQVMRPLSRWESLRHLTGQSAPSGRAHTACAWNTDAPTSVSLDGETGSLSSAVGVTPQSALRGSCAMEVAPHLDDALVAGLDRALWERPEPFLPPALRTPFVPSTSLAGRVDVDVLREEVASDGVPIAEKFRLAYASREARLAIKQAKNERQQARRAWRNKSAYDHHMDAWLDHGPYVNI